MKSRFAPHPKRLVSTLLLVALGAAQAYTLDDALRHAQSWPTVVVAEQELAAAREDLDRTVSDPFALRLDKVQAQQRVALSDVKVDESYLTAISEIGTAYAAQLQALSEQQTARASEALSRRLLEVAQVRQERGSATGVEVREAEAALEVARAVRHAADETLIFARNTLRGILPLEAEVGTLEPIAQTAIVRPLPPISAVLSAATKTTALLTLQQAVTLARLNLSLLDPSYSSAREIEAANTALETANSTFTETTRTRFAEVRTLYAQTSAAQELYLAQQRSTRAAKSRLRLQQERFALGLASELELNQSELDTMNVQLETMRAKHNYVTSLLQLQTLAAMPLWPIAPNPGQASNAAGTTEEGDQEPEKETP